ncbi:MAG: DUF2521 family protein [Bacillus sp. (in: firmicutes)]
MDNVISTFRERQKEKQIQYERSVLKEVTAKALKERFAAFLANQSNLGISPSQVLEEGCYDVAIESYLLGSHFSKFGYYGESVDDVRKRCEVEERHLVDTMYNFILYWGKISDFDVYNETLYYHCEQYVRGWWDEGFTKGEKRYKLRLH